MYKITHETSFGIFESLVNAHTEKEVIDYIKQDVKEDDDKLLEIYDVKELTGIGILSTNRLM